MGLLQPTIKPNIFTTAQITKLNQMLGFEPMQIISPVHEPKEVAASGPNWCQWWDLNQWKSLFHQSKWWLVAQTGVSDWIWTNGSHYFTKASGPNCVSDGIWTQASHKSLYQRKWSKLVSVVGFEPKQVINHFTKATCPSLCQWWD